MREVIYFDVIHELTSKYTTEEDEENSRRIFSVATFVVVGVMTVIGIRFVIHFDERSFFLPLKATLIHDVLLFSPFFVFFYFEIRVNLSFLIQTCP